MVLTDNINTKNAMQSNSIKTYVKHFKKTALKYPHLNCNMMGASSTPVAFCSKIQALPWKNRINSQCETHPKQDLAYSPSTAG